MLVYSNNEKLVTWYDTYRAIQQIEGMYYHDYPIHFYLFLELAQKLGANYYVIDFPPPAQVEENYPVELVYQNAKYTLYAIKLQSR